ncbi:MAG: DNA polymerase III subunit delta [Pseudomonadota bacterium]
MVAVKAHQADAFLKRMPADVVALVFYGTDAGLISERAGRAASQLAAREDPPGDILRISDGDLDENPDRLLVELQTFAMFGGRTTLRTSASRKLTAALLEPAFAQGPPGANLIIEAGNLKPSDGIRKLFEKLPLAAAIACYADGARDLSTVIDEVFAQTGHRISRDDKALLQSRLGADRALSRGEVTKLALYAHGRSEVTAQDIEAVIGDAAEVAMDRAILAAAAGNALQALREFDRIEASGESAQTVILLTLRQFQRLHRLQAAIEQGQALKDAMRSLRPPLHFKQQDTVASLMPRWSLLRLNRALTLIDDAQRDARLSSANEAMVCERMLLALSALASRPRAAPAASRRLA